MADALKAAGHEVERRRIEVPEHIKQLGSYDVTVRFHGGVCLAGTQTMRGIAAIDASSTPNVLYAAVLDPARSGGFVIAATR